MSDDQICAELLTANEEEIEQISADGAFDRRKVYRVIENRKINQAAIGSPEGGRIWRRGNAKRERLIRDENWRSIRKKRRKKWKQASN